MIRFIFWRDHGRFYVSTNMNGIRWEVGIANTVAVVAVQAARNAALTGPVVIRSRE